MGMADRIKERRLALGLTQEELANRLGLQKSAIAKYENGRVENIKRSIISKMAEVLECTPPYLMGWEETQSAMKPGINIVDKEGNVTSLNVDAAFISMVEDILNLPPERQELVYDVVAAQKKRNKPIIFVPNPHNSRPSHFADAASAREDIEIPEGTDTTDNDIMDDENF